MFRWPVAVTLAPIDPSEAALALSSDLEVQGLLLQYAAYCQPPFFLAGVWLAVGWRKVGTPAKVPNLATSWERGMVGSSWEAAPLPS